MALISTALFALLGLSIRQNSPATKAANDIRCSDLNVTNGFVMHDRVASPPVYQIVCDGKNQGEFTCSETTGWSPELPPCANSRREAKNDLEDVLKTENKGGCPDWNACDKYCRSQGYQLGECFGTYCGCTDQGAANDIDEDVTAENEGGCPDENVCAKYCESQGYPIGECYDTYCSCMHIGANKEKDLTAENEGGCPDENACADYCERQGYAIGECYDTYCSCMHIGANHEKDLKAENEGGCPDENACADYCESEGYALGECYDTYCSCMNLGANNNNKEIPKTEDDGGCPDDDACAEYCKGQGLPIGYCVGTTEETRTKCICMRIGSNNFIQEVLKPENDGGCPDTRRCSKWCQAKGKSRGTCWGGRLALICECH